MAPSILDESWRGWIRENIRRGCAVDELEGILLERGFEPSTVKQALRQVRSLPTRTASLQRYESDTIELYTAANFLSKEECEQIITLMKKRLRPSSITRRDETDECFRTNKSCDLACLDESAIRSLDARICRAMGIDPIYSEPLQGQYYDVGDEFKPHTDYFEEDEMHRFAGGELGQRTWTFMIYLNEPTEGGETAFVCVGAVLRPKAGLAVTWNNLTPEGCANMRTLHCGMPVVAGFKAIVTKWFRQ
jgi:prolyl 4-hydroxylase